MARVSFVEKGQGLPMVEDLYQKMEKRDQRLLNLFKILGHSPYIGLNWHRLGNSILTGEELPPIRVLAEQLLVNPNTVARAYRELETAGVVSKRRTAGTYVSQTGSPLRRRERLRILTGRVDALLAEARQMDVTVDDVFKLIRQRDDNMRSRSKEK